MINLILKEARKIIDSDEYYEGLKKIGLQCEIDEDAVGSLFHVVSEVLLGEILEENFVKAFASDSGLSLKKSTEIYPKVKAVVFDSFKRKMALIIGENTSIIPPKNESTTIPTVTPLRTPTQQPPTSRPEEPLTKDYILSQIENPPRTVIKRYVIEHEPITDPEKLIDDTVDERPKLQEHYND